MKFAGFTLALAGLFAGSVWAQTPTISGLLNNYSNTLPGLPNYGIAEVSIFDIYGANLASASVPLQSPPLETTVGGVSDSDHQRRRQRGLSHYRGGKRLWPVDDEQRIRDGTIFRTLFVPRARSDQCCSPRGSLRLLRLGGSPDWKLRKHLRDHPGGPQRPSTSPAIDGAGGGTTEEGFASFFNNHILATRRGSLPFRVGIGFAKQLHGQFL